MLCPQGNGYTTDPTIIASTGISDPNPFFRQLLAKPYLNNVVISPHLYGPSITKMRTGYTGQALWDTLSHSVGYLNQRGYCDGSNCHRFPIVVGETGSSLEDARDKDFYRDLEAYLKNSGPANDGRHAVITDNFWWSWNANSVSLVGQRSLLNQDGCGC